MSTRPLLIAVLAVAGSCAAAVASAQTTTLYTEYVKTITAAKDVHPYDEGLFGDEINLYTGSVEFSVQDVSLAGNSTIPVAVGRRYVVEDREGLDLPIMLSKHNAQFGDWSLDVPYLTGVFARVSGWVSGDVNDLDSRCSVTNIHEAAPRSFPTSRPAPPCSRQGNTGTAISCMCPARATRK